MPNDVKLARTFVELADTLVESFDVIDLLTLLTDRCVDILAVDEAGLMLALPPDGRLHVMASSSEAMRLIELFELQTEEGPCLDCYRTGAALVNQDLDAADGRWPTFATLAVANGYHAVHALPMRLRGEVIGALNLFQHEKDAMTAADIATGQALADIATIAILQHRAAQERQLLAEQLQTALDSRIVIEQAKGKIAQAQKLDMQDAFSHLRTYARAHNQRLSDVAAAIVRGELSPQSVRQD